ncbi:MAG: PEP-CTERM sorting domain-containing protein [Planctomycetota bacterium]
MTDRPVSRRPPHRTLFAWFIAAVVSAGSLTSPTSAQGLYINEIFFDPGSSGFSPIDIRDEFIEIRGPANFSLDNHYLVFLESEDNATNTGPAGLIDNIFDLNGVSTGSNGFLVLRTNGGIENNVATGPSPYTVVPGATDLLNTGSGNGYGSGGTSSIGASDVGNDGTVENGGFTALLIRNDTGSAPVLNTDLDTDNNGLDDPNGQAGWTILDSVTAFEPFEAIFGQAYGKAVFGKEEIGQQVFFEGGIVTVNPDLEPGAEYFGGGYEVEHLARWGNSTGQGVDDWHATNLTANPGSGFQASLGIPDLRQSFTGDHGDLATSGINTPANQPTPSQGDLESNQGVPYGTVLLDNVGGPNFILGSFNGDGVVSAADYAVYRDTVGATATELAPQPADHDRSFVVDEGDLAFFVANFGAPGSGTASPAVQPVSVAGAVVPEPSAAILLGLGVAHGLGKRRRRG